MTYHEAILLGILYTDGCLSKKGRNSWRFYLANTSWQIIEIFKISMMNFFNLPASRIRISQKEVNGKPFYKAVVDSARSGRKLIKQYGTFRTLCYKKSKQGSVYPPTRLPLFKGVNPGLLAQFLKVAFSCDGGVNLYVARAKYPFLIRNVYLACKHPQLQIDYQGLLKRVGIQTNIISSDGKILIQGQEKLRRFSEKIGFLPEVRITQNSAYWQGWEKSKVLDLALASYGKPQLIFKLPQFNS